MGRKGWLCKDFLPARKLFDGSAAVRAPEVFKEYTAPSHCFTHVKQPTGCAAMLGPCGFGKIKWHLLCMIKAGNSCSQRRCGRVSHSCIKFREEKLKKYSHHLLPGIFLSAV